jgi:hypothetical protein
MPNPRKPFVAKLACRRRSLSFDQAHAVVPPAITGMRLRSSSCRNPAVAIAESTFGKLFRLAKICRLFRLQLFFRAYRLYRKRAK